MNHLKEIYRWSWVLGSGMISFLSVGFCQENPKKVLAPKVPATIEKASIDSMGQILKCLDSESIASFMQSSSKCRDLAKNPEVVHEVKSVKLSPDDFVDLKSHLDYQKIKDTLHLGIRLRVLSLGSLVTLLNDPEVQSREKGLDIGDVFGTQEEISADQKDAFASLNQFSSLEVFSLHLGGAARGARRGGDILNLVKGPLSQLSGLKAIRFSHFFLPIKEKLDALNEVLAHKPELRHLTLEDAGLDALQLPVLVPVLKQCAKLSVLNLNGSILKAGGMDPLIRIFQEGTGFRRDLKSLELAYNLIGDEGVGKLANFLMLQRDLRRLNLSYNLITDRGIDDLVGSLKDKTQFELIDLRYNAIANPDGVLNKLKTLKERNPKLKILINLSDMSHYHNKNYGCFK